MKITIEVKDENNLVQKRGVRISYLTKFVDEKKEYPVSHTIDNNGKRVNTPTMLKGEDLSQNQIAELFSKELL